MLDLRAKLGQYLHDDLGIETTVADWEMGNRVPLFLRDRYRFFQIEIMSLRCLFMADRLEKEESPATIRKHVDQVQSKWTGHVVYMRERITAYNRKRLIEHKLPFIVPGNQMYLPMLGIDLREYFKKLRRNREGGLGPAAQAVLIHALLQDDAALGPTVLGRRLGYSVMTMSRALDELEAVGLGESTVAGRERHLRLVKSKRVVWDEAQPFLRTPVVKRFAIRLPPGAALPGLRAGLDALAHYSMLAEPNITIALGREGWKALQQSGLVQTAMADEPGALTIELWSYPPALFADGEWVDRLSLHLSLSDIRDERVEAALDQMIKEVPW
jgi:DNA-binding MarR family transcriptional regulator